MIGIATVHSAGDKVGAAVLNASVALAHELKLAIVAEGVLTESDARRLKDAGCEYGQRLCYGWPLSSADVEAFLSARLR